MCHSCGGYSHAYGDSYANFYSYSYVYANGDSYSNAHTDGDCYCYSYINTDTYSDANSGEAFADAEAASNNAAA